MRYAGRVLGVLAAVVAVLGVLFVGLLTGIQTINHYQEHQMSPACELELSAILLARVGSEVDFRDLTDFEWDEVRQYGEYSNADRARATGLVYDPPFDHIPEAASLLTFHHAGHLVCATLVHHSYEFHLVPADLQKLKSGTILRVSRGDYRNNPDLQPINPLDDLNVRELDPFIQELLFQKSK